MCVCVCVLGNIATRDERKRKYGPFDNFVLLQILKQCTKEKLCRESPFARVAPLVKHSQIV